MSYEKNYFTKDVQDRAVKSKFKLSLKAYGLSRESEMWVINYIENSVCEAQILSAGLPKSNFDNTKFKCRIGDSAVELLGADIFFTEESATDYLNYIKRVNNDTLKEYYPNFEKNSSFLEYINHFRITQFGENPYSSVSYNYNDASWKSFYSLAIFAPVNINGYTFEPNFPLGLDFGNRIENLLRDFLKLEAEKRAKYEKKQELLNQLSEYEQNSK